MAISALTNVANATSGSAIGSVDIPVGSLIIAVTHDVSTTVGSFTDSVGNTYHLADSCVYGGVICVYYAYNCIHAPIGTTFSFAGGGGTRGLSVGYATGADTTAFVLNAFADTTGLPTTEHVSVTPTVADSLFIGISATNGGGSPVISSGWSASPAPMFGSFDMCGSILGSGLSSENWNPTGMNSPTGASAIICAFGPFAAVPNESIAGAQTLQSLTQAGVFEKDNETIAGAQTLALITQSAALFKPGAPGTGLRQFSTFGG